MILEDHVKDWDITRRVISRFAANAATDYAQESRDSQKITSAEEFDIENTSMTRLLHMRGLLADVLRFHGLDIYPVLDEAVSQGEMKAVDLMYFEDIEVDLDEAIAHFEKVMKQIVINEVARRRLLRDEGQDASSTRYYGNMAQYISLSDDVYVHQLVLDHCRNQLNGSSHDHLMKRCLDSIIEEGKTVMTDDNEEELSRANGYGSMRKLKELMSGDDAISDADAYSVINLLIRGYKEIGEKQDTTGFITLGMMLDGTDPEVEFYRRCGEALAAEVLGKKEKELAETRMTVTAYREIIELSHSAAEKIKAGERESADEDVEALDALSEKYSTVWDDGLEAAINLQKDWYRLSGSGKVIEATVVTAGEPEAPGNGGAASVKPGPSQVVPSEPGKTPGDSELGDDDLDDDEPTLEEDILEGLYAMQDIHNDPVDGYEARGRKIQSLRNRLYASVAGGIAAAALTFAFTAGAFGIWGKQDSQVVGAGMIGGSQGSDSGNVGVDVLTPSDVGAGYVEENTEPVPANYQDLAFLKDIDIDFTLDVNVDFGSAAEYAAALANKVVDVMDGAADKPKHVYMLFSGNLGNLKVPEGVSAFKLPDQTGDNLAVADPQPDNTPDDTPDNLNHDLEYPGGGRVLIEAIRPRHERNYPHPELDNDREPVTAPNTKDPDLEQTVADEPAHKPVKPVDMTVFKDLLVQAWDNTSSFAKGAYGAVYAQTAGLDAAVLVPLVNSSRAALDNAYLLASNTLAALAAQARDAPKPADPVPDKPADQPPLEEKVAEIGMYVPAQVTVLPLRKASQDDVKKGALPYKGADGESSVPASAVVDARAVAPALQGKPSATFEAESRYGKARRDVILKIAGYTSEQAADVTAVALIPVVPDSVVERNYKAAAEFCRELEANHDKYGVRLSVKSDGAEVVNKEITMDQFLNIATRKLGYGGRRPTTNLGIGVVINPTNTGYRIDFDETTTAQSLKVTRHNPLGIIEMDDLKCEKKHKRVDSVFSSLMDNSDMTSRIEVYKR